MSPVLWKAAQIHELLNVYLILRWKHLARGTVKMPYSCPGFQATSEPLQKRGNWVFVVTSWWMCLTNRLSGGCAKGKQSHLRICKQLSFVGCAMVYKETRVASFGKKKHTYSPRNDWQLSSIIAFICKWSFFY